MLELIIKDVIYSDLPIFINSAEIENGKFMPTYELLEKLSKDFPDYIFYFAFGSDIAPGLTKWEFGKEIIEKYNPILITRPGYDVKENKSKINYYDKCKLITSNLEGSSTTIRNRIDESLIKKNRIHLGISGLTSRSVLEYIYKNTLYKVESIEISPNMSKCRFKDYSSNENIDEADDVIKDGNNNNFKLFKDKNENKNTNNNKENGKLDGNNKNVNNSKF